MLVRPKSIAPLQAQTLSLSSKWVHWLSIISYAIKLIASLIISWSSNIIFQPSVLGQRERDNKFNTLNIFPSGFLLQWQQITKLIVFIHISLGKVELHWLNFAVSVCINGNEILNLIVKVSHLHRTANRYLYSIHPNKEKLWIHSWNFKGCECPWSQDSACSSDSLSDGAEAAEGVQTVHLPGNLPSSFARLPVWLSAGIPVGQSVFLSELRSTSLSFHFLL